MPRLSARSTVALRFAFGATALCIAIGANGASLPWEVWTSAGRIAELDPASEVLERSSYCPDACRYDHANLTWEGIAANPYPYRWLYADGAEEIVFDDEGPGAITRLWVTAGNCIDPLTGVRFYVDGAAEPVLSVPLRSLFDGSTPPFTPPLAYAREQSSGGFVSYVPIAYAQRLRVALTNADNGYNVCTGDSYRALWFQFQYHHLLPGTPVVSFDGISDSPGLRALLAHTGDDPWAGSLTPALTSDDLAAASTLPIGNRTGAGWLRGIRLQVPRAAYSDINLRIAPDGVVTVDVPLADFFAVGAGNVAAARGVLVGEGDDGWLYAWFPMPYRSGLSAALHASAALPAPIAVQAVLYWDDTAVSARAGTFTTQLRDTCPSTPGNDNVLYGAYGSGRIVGVSAAYHAYGAATREYLEGDERAYRDGAVTPAWYGTGVEDFFNGAFYFVLGPYARELSGATAVDADGTGVTTAYRLMPTDYLDYASQLELRQEAGPTGQLPMCVRNVVWAYAASASVVSYDHFEVGDPLAASRHEWQPPTGTACTNLSSAFGDEPSTPRSAQVCSYTSGVSRFSFSPQSAASPLRLRRTFDAAQPGQAADVLVNGAVAGRFSYTAANAARRWQQQDIPLDTPANAGTFDIEIHPRFGGTDGAALFTESAYELLGGTVDPVFAAGFDGAP